MKSQLPTSQSAHDAFSSARQLSDQFINGAEKALDNGRHLSHDTLALADHKLHQLRGSIDPVVEKLTTQAQKLARQSLDMAAEASDRAQRSMHRYADATTRYVAKEPVKAVLIAAAVGAVVALLVAAARERQSR